MHYVVGVRKNKELNWIFCKFTEERGGFHSLVPMYRSYNSKNALSRRSQKVLQEWREKIYMFSMYGWLDTYYRSEKYPTLLRITS